jgi:hypothetical protein
MCKAPITMESLKECERQDDVFERANDEIELKEENDKNERLSKEELISPDAPSS